VAKKIKSEGGPTFRVVSMPCVENFQELSSEQREQIVPAGARIVTIEAGSTIGWKALFGTKTVCIGIDHFGSSAPGELLAEKFGFSIESISARILAD